MLLELLVDTIYHQERNFIFLQTFSAPGKEKWGQKNL